jgi:hypothetical protein
MVRDGQDVDAFETFLREDGYAQVKTVAYPAFRDMGLIKVGFPVLFQYPIVNFADHK